MSLRKPPGIWSRSCKRQAIRLKHRLLPRPTQRRSIIWKCSSHRMQQRSFHKAIHSFWKHMATHRPNWQTLSWKCSRFWEKSSVKFSMPSEFLFLFFFKCIAIKYYKLKISISRSPNASPRKHSKEVSQKSAHQENAHRNDKSFRIQKANDIDEGAWFVCNKAWDLLESPVNESNELLLNERLADIQVMLSFSLPFTSTKRSENAMKIDWFRIHCRRFLLSNSSDNCIRSIYNISTRFGE